MQRAMRKRKSRVKYVVLGVVIIAVVIVASAIMLIRPITPKASEYLRVTHSRSLGEFVYPDASLVHLKTLGLDITAVAGDANSVLVDLDGLLPGTGGDTNMNMLIPKGETWSVALPLTGMYLTLDPATGNYTYEEVRVSLHEAESEEFTIQIPPDEISTTQLKLTILPSTNGHTTPENGAYWYSSGTNVTLSAIPDSGFVFDHWIINSQNITTNPYTLTITGITAVEARFKIQP